MTARSNSRRVHFQSPADLVERIDAVAEVFETDRTDLLVEAMRAYVRERADDEEFQELVASQYYDDRLSFEEVKRLVGPETAQRFRLLKADLEAEPLDLDPPEDVDVYDGDRRAVDPDAGVEQ